ncbi:MAG: YitT family protein [Eubacteriales bacterium]|jgi:uncharacterized membrane-anchored protein YitT (DUF2179 family)
MTKINWKWELTRYAWMVAASVVFSLGFSLFLSPNSIVTGGVTGLGIVINRFSGVSIGVISMALNLPILAAGWRVMGKRFIVECLITSAVLNTCIDAVAWLPPLTQDRLMAAVYGGLLLGTAYGLYFRTMLSSGGTELLARLVHRKLRTWSLSVLLGVLDGCVVLIGAVALQDPQNVLYALIVIFISTKVSDGVISGFHYAQICFIITNLPEEISTALLQRSPRGITRFEGVGMYTHEPRSMLMTVVKKPDFIPMKETVRSIDPNAFVIVAQSTEVLGYGFRDIQENQ